jgi:hypothetical protein
MITHPEPFLFVGSNLGILNSRKTNILAYFYCRKAQPVFSSPTTRSVSNTNNSFNLGHKNLRMRSLACFYIQKRFFFKKQSLFFLQKQKSDKKTQPDISSYHNKKSVLPLQEKLKKHDRVLSFIKKKKTKTLVLYQQLGVLGQKYLYKRKKYKPFIDELVTPKSSLFYSFKNLSLKLSGPLF